MLSQTSRRRKKKLRMTGVFFFGVSPRRLMELFPACLPACPEEIVKINLAFRPANKRRRWIINEIFRRVSRPVDVINVFIAFACQITDHN